MSTASLDRLCVLSRRRVLEVGLTAAITGLWSALPARAQDLVPDALQRRFLDWSRMATGFADLPAVTARAYLELVLRSGVTVEALSGLDRGAYRGSALEKRLLEAWYTGVFKIASSDMRSYDTTLMWQAAGIDPSPTSCGGTPERWASAPSNI